VTDKYEDIIHLPHHVSKKYPQMPVSDRAAQFIPFMALTGYEDAVEETARLTERKIDLDETQKNLLDDLLRSASESGETVAVLYFQPDKRKAGGAYSMKTGIIKKIDAYGNCVKMEDGTEIPIEDIMDINSELHIL
jgi:hypothetical protein